jgi:hypothetical protein
MEVVSEQMRTYYDRRAAEYDDWWLGTGLFESRVRPGWSTRGDAAEVDSAKHEGVKAEEWQERVLKDGSRHPVYKRFFSAGDLAKELGGGKVLHDGWFVVVATGWDHQRGLAVQT